MKEEGHGEKLGRVCLLAAFTQSHQTLITSRSDDWDGGSPPRESRSLDGRHDGLRQIL